MEYRIEKDTMGEMQVPADRYWAAQTQRSYQNFRIGDEIMPREITRAFGILKKAAALANCKLGKLSEEKKNILLQTIIKLGDEKKTVFATDLPFIINDIFETKTNNDFKVLNFSINSTYKLKSIANVRCSFRGKEAEEAAQGDGGYDAFMNALKKILKQFELQIPKLTDYTVEIPPGGRTNAMVQAVITWEVEQQDGKVKKITTKGLNHDQNTAAIEATLKIINFIS